MHSARGKPDFFCLNVWAGSLEASGAQRERELKMMEEKSAAKCTRRSGFSLREGRKTEGATENRGRRSRKCSRAAASADGGGGRADADGRRARSQKCNLKGEAGK